MPTLPHDKGIMASLMAPPLTILWHRRRTIQQQHFVNRRPLFFQKFRPHGLPERLVFKQIHHRQAHCFARIYHPLVPDGHPAAGDHRPTVPGGFLGRSRNDKRYLRGVPTHIRYVGRASFGVFHRFPQRFDFAIKPDLFDAGGRLDFFGKLHFLRRIVDFAEQFQVFLQGFGACPVDEQFPIAGFKREFRLHARHYRCAFDDLLHTGPDFFDPFAIAVPDPKVDFCKIRHDVGYIAAVLDDIMDADARLDVLSQLVQPVQAKFDGVEGAAPVPGVVRLRGLPCPETRYCN